ncbi:PDGLE domain-containing protein [Gorillibacterium sp. sgz5001074]|uniref:PDGLE domain-containing protein n=1 Tax=Gorillibacterium sp. sgz5001074 TaxID=3446695 RepID=UPI003F6750C7
MKSHQKLLWTGLLAAVLIAGFLSPYASSKPDGLERVAEDHGFLSEEREAAWTTPLSGYEWKGAGGSPSLAVGAAGLAGVALTFGAAILLFRTLGKKSRGTKDI